VQSPVVNKARWVSRVQRLAGPVSLASAQLATDIAKTPALRTRVAALAERFA
jgi:hypothetical protein